MFLPAISSREKPVLTQAVVVINENDASHDVVSFQLFVADRVGSTSANFRWHASPVPTCASMMVRTCEPWLKRASRPSLEKSSRYACENIDDLLSRARIL